MNKKISRILALVLVFTMLVPMFSFASGDMDVDIKQIEEKMLKEMESGNKDKTKDKTREKVNVDLEKYSSNKNGEERVRVIVELEGDSKLDIVNNKKTKLNTMNSLETNKLEKSILKEQNTVKKELKKKLVDIDFVYEFDTVINGFSGDTKVKNIEKIAGIKGVKKVYIANTYEAPEITVDMETSHEIIENILQSQQYGKYNGEGMVVAVIDSGIDPNHPDFVLSDNDKAKIKKEDVEALGLKGKYFSPKIPYAYNYTERNHDVIDSQGINTSMHGQHVSGTVAANGGIKGVAPEAQILGLKVFNNDPMFPGGASDDRLIQAIEDAIALDADVINMSLGVTADFHDEDSALDKAISKAELAGIIPCISAGNEEHLTTGHPGAPFPHKQDPDYGLLGSPGRTKNAIQVASLENKQLLVEAVQYIVDGEIELYQGFISRSSRGDDFYKREEWTDFIDAGHGSKEDMKGAEGKVVVAQRGGPDDCANFATKMENAIEAKAAAIVVYNREDSDDNRVNMGGGGDDDFFDIPAVFVPYELGRKLIENKDEASLSFKGDQIFAKNEEFGQMSDFSSWGPSPSLELKPEITGPGGQILSTLNNGKYGMMSGTSMSAPHLSGISAIMLQYVNDQEIYKDMTALEKSQLVKTLLMNTAEIVKVDGIDLNKEGLEDLEPAVEVSPRKQGAGLAKVKKAMDTPVRVIDLDSGQAKSELKEIKDTNITLNYKATNDSKEDLVYKVDAFLMKDRILPYGGFEFNVLESEYIEIDYDIEGVNKHGLLMIPAGGSKEFRINIDFKNDKKIYHNMFIDGFVTLEDVSDNYPELSVPVMGFYGDWLEPRILDAFVGHSEEVDQVYGETRFISDVNEEGYIQVHSGERISLNPGTSMGKDRYTDHVRPQISLLRNAAELQFNILDEKGNRIVKLGNDLYNRKNFFNHGYGSTSRVYDTGRWDCRAKGSLVEDGNYFYEIKAKLDFEGAEFETQTFPIIIDTVGPDIYDIEFDEETCVLRYKLKDDGVGLAFSSIFIGEQDLKEFDPSAKIIFSKAENEENVVQAEVDLSQLKELEGGRHTILIGASDDLNNMSFTKINYENENRVAYLYSNYPYPMWTTRTEWESILEDGKLLVDGHIANFEYLEKVRLIDEADPSAEEIILNLSEDDFVEKVEIFDPLRPKKMIYDGPAYKYETEMEFEEGVHSLRIEAISSKGVTNSIVRDFVLDFTAPEMEILKDSFNPETNELTIKVLASDTLKERNNYISLIRDKNNIDSEYAHACDENGNIVFTDVIDLNDEYYREFEYIVSDRAGNSVSQVIRFNEKTQDIEVIDKTDIEDIKSIDEIPIGTVIVEKEGFTKRLIDSGDKYALDTIRKAKENNQIILTKISDEIYRIQDGINLNKVYVENIILVHDINGESALFTPFN